MRLPYTGEFTYHIIPENLSGDQITISDENIEESINLRREGDKYRLIWLDEFGEILDDGFTFEVVNA